MSFNSNYLKLRAEREGSSANNAGGSTPPATSQEKPSGSGTNSYTSSYLALREKRNNMTISERAVAKAQALQKKQQEYARTPAGILSGYGRSNNGLTTSGGYYSRPTLGSASERLYSNITALEPVLTEKRAAMDTAQTSLMQAETDLKTVQGYLQQARAVYDADPTNENATSYNQIVGAYNLAYDSYTSAFDAYSVAYDDYKPYEDQLIDALAIYQLYSDQQQAAFDDWRGTIRDAATIQTEITAIDQQMADLEVAEAAAAEAARQQQLAEYQARQDAKPWYEKLAGYLGGVQDTTLPLAGVTPGTVEDAFNQPENPPSREMQQLIAMKELLQEELNWGQYYYYADFAGAPDFAEMSKYVPQEEKEQRALDIMLDNYSSDAAPWEDPLYEYINGNEEAGAWLSNAGANYYGPDNAIGAFFGRATENKAESQQMTEQEVATFNYLYATQGKAAAHAYYDYLLADLNYRQRKADEEYWAEYAAKDPVGSSVFSVAMSPMKGLSYIGQLTDFLADGELTEDAPYNSFSYIPGTIRETVPENWGAVGTFAYQTGMSMADFLLTTAITGGNQTAALTIMGSGAAADTTLAAKDRGLEDWQAFTLGTVAGLAEVLTEKVSLDKLFDADLLADGTLKYILGNAFAEGSEEVASSTINLLADIIVSKDQSEWQQSINAYMEEGLTEGQAFARAMADQALSLGADFLGGFISGGAMGGGGAVIGSINTEKIGDELGNLQMNDEDIQSFIETGLESDPETASYKIAVELQGKIQKGQKLSNYDLSRLYQANVQAQPEAVWDSSTAPKNVSLPRLDDESGGEVSAEAMRRQAQTDYRAGKITEAEFDAIIDEVMHLEELEDGTSVKTFGNQADINTQTDNININVNGGTTYDSIHQQPGRPAAAQSAGGFDTQRAGISDGVPIRDAGQGAGIQTGQMASSAGRQGIQTNSQAKAIVERQNTAGDLRQQGLISATSSLALGIESGTDTENLYVMPQEYYDAELLQAAQFARAETGLNVAFTVGNIEINRGSRTGKVRGVHTGQQIVVQSDNAKATAMQLVKHEVFHDKVMKDPGLTQRLKEEVRDRFTPQEFDAVMDRYIDELWPLYGPADETAWDEYERAWNIILEEMLADAYAGINAFGAHAEQFTETVSELTPAKTVDKQQKQDNGTEEPTGPPSDKLSFEDWEGLSLPSLEDNMASDYEGRSLVNDPEIYTYEFLISQPPMMPVELPPITDVRDAQGKIDTAKVVRNGIKNALPIGSARDGRTYVKNRYTGRDLLVTTAAIRHGLNGAANRMLTNARLGSVIGEIVRNAIPINALHNTADGVEGTYAMAGYAFDQRGREFIAIITVEQRTDAVEDITVYDITHAISGRQKRSSRQEPTASIGGSQADTKSQGINLIKASSEISIADMLEAVKEVYQSILPNDVLAHMGETRNPEGHYTGRVRYSFAGENANNADLDALARAKEMRSAGVADETIRQQTGWHTGMDGKWRWEIDDSAMRYDSSGDLRGAESAKWAMEDYESARDDLWGHADMGTLEKVRAYNRADIAGDDATKQELYDELINGQYAYYFDQYVEAMTRAQGARNAPAGGTLQDYIDHPALFEAYPQLRNVTLRFERMGGGMMGYYSRTDNEIVLNTELRYAAEDTLVHEIQHAIQKAEGFTRGSNEEYWKHRQDGDDAVHVYDAKIQESEKKMDEIMRQLPENVAEQFRQWSAMDESSLEAMALMQELWGGPYNDLFEDYWFLNFGLDDMRRTNHKRGYRDLYRNTAGEIEARDVTARRSLTSDQRRSQEPARGDSYTVFMEDSDELSLQMGDRYSTDDVDSHGHSLTPEQQAFFADSKVRDENGRLLPVYHGSKSSGFNVFQYSEKVQTGTDYGKAFYFTSDYEKASGYSYDAGKDPRIAEYRNNRNELMRRFLATHSEQDKNAFLNYRLNGMTARDMMDDEGYQTEGGEVKAVYLNITNPHVADANGEYYYKVYPDYFEAARKNGNDGIIVKNVIDNPRGTPRPIDVYIAFEQDQIKSTTNRRPTHNPDIRYSVDDGGQDPAQLQAAAEFDQDTISGNIRQVAQMEPVTSISGHEFAKGEVDLITQVETFFNQRGNRAYSPELGEVILDRRGIKSDIAHGIGRKKAAAFAAVPDAIEHGLVVDYQKDWKGRGYDTAVVAAPITIGTEDHIAAVILTRSNQTNRFYVHEVLTTKNGAMPFKTGAQKKGAPGGDAPSVFSILDKIRSVKNGSKSQEKFSADDMDASGANELRENMTTKEREILRGVETRLLRNIGGALSATKFGDRSYLKGVIQGLSDTYLESGTIEQQAMDDLFEQAYRQGIVVDRELHDQYEEVRKYLHTVSLTLDPRDRSDIADYPDFVKRMRGRMRIVNEGGLPVDSAWHELNDMAPELFPDSIAHPADQLVRMAEVLDSLRIAEKSLSDYYGPMASTYKKDAKAEFERAVWESIGELCQIRRFEQERQQKLQEAEPAPTTPEEAMEAWAKLKTARKTYEKAMAKNLLTTEDEIAVGELLKGKMLPEHLDKNNLNVKGILAVYEAKQEYEHLTKLLAEYRRKVKADIRAEADTYLETANTWKDKDIGLLYSREIMQRNVEDIVPDKKLAKRINERYFEPVRDAEAAAVKMKEEYREAVRKLNLSRNVKKGNFVSEAHAVQLYGEAMDNIRILEKARGRLKHRDGKSLEEWRGVVYKLWQENPGLDKAKIESAVTEMRQIYDELFRKMNEVRVRWGYEPVNYRQGYFPHFQPGDGDGIMAQFGRVLGIDTQVVALPTTINGLTHTFKPGIQWFGNAQERLGFNTAYDAVEGFDRYIEGVASVICQTENIQRLRALASQIRYRTSDEGIRKQVDAIYSNAALTEEQKNDAISGIYEKGRYTLSNFVVEVDEYTNLLANKKSKLDRTVEALIGRKFYTAMKWLESRVGANMIAGNVTSALTNFIPLTQASAQLSKKAMLKGMWDTLASYKTDDGIIDRSAFLTNRRGSDPLVKVWSTKVSEVLGKPMELIDSFTSGSIVRAAYYQNLKQGLSESEAMHQADIFASRVMAERSKGGMPTLFESKNPFFKLFTQFQLEVNNQWSEVFKDIPRSQREKGLGALALVFLQYFLGAWLFNNLYEKWIGRRPAMDPIDIVLDTVKDFASDDVSATDALGNLANNVLEEIPFSSALTLVGIETDGGRVPVSSGIPNIPTLVNATTNEDWAPEKRWKEAQDELNKLAYVIPPFGGNQVSKIWKGIKAYIEGGSYSVDSDGNDILQYPVYNDESGDFWGLVQAMLLGKSALPEAKEWVEDGFDSLSAKQTAIYQDMIDSGVSEREAYDLIDSLRSATKTDEVSKKEAQIRILQDAAASDECKAIAFYGLLATDNERLIMDSLTDSGAMPGPAMDVLIQLRDAAALPSAEEKVAQADILVDSALTEIEKEIVIRSWLDDQEVNENGNLTSLGKFNLAMKQGITTEEYLRFRATGMEIDKLLEYTEAGFEADEAQELAQAFDELEPLPDKSTVSNLQKWRACVDFSDDVEDQLTALSMIDDMEPESLAVWETANKYGVAPDVYVTFQEIATQYDTNGNGSYTQAEAKAAIDAEFSHLTTAQKAVLWQWVCYSSGSKKNPYDPTVGQNFIDSRDAAKAAAEE